MASDGLDGFLARRYRLATPMGTLLDPLMDRFFVFFVIAVLMQEESFTIWQASALLCRDFAVLLFGLYLVFSRKLTSYRFRAIWCGKVTTFLQFIVFLILSLECKIPSWCFLTFVLLGLFALIELYLSKDSQVLYNVP
ncbi:MAG TPA: CDP-alcohol phosphatidyltransferase family protein, partial [Waddliaceae bacterium]